ncbi:MAG: hypothetical protein Q7R91_01060 [bacterium]|nr:hypothetical protein [bacterium]
MKTIIVAILFAFVLLNALAVYADHQGALGNTVVTPDVPNLPNFTKSPFFLVVDHVVFPSRVHPEWPQLPLAIFMSNEKKNDFIGVYYDDKSIRYAEWATDTEAGLAVIRGYWYIDGKFVFDKEIPG